MLEGTVARILNQLLGKYVEDLDTENLNVGIFSGKVQLTDLKLKPEALYELNLPIEVKAGTLGKIWLQIPWTALWSQPIVVNIEDIHIVVNPIVRNEPFDAEKNKRLLRAFKKRTLELLDYEGGILGVCDFLGEGAGFDKDLGKFGRIHGYAFNLSITHMGIATKFTSDDDNEAAVPVKNVSGPSAFAEHLVSNILNYIQINITNVHVRYEDEFSWTQPIAAGLCIGSLTAQTTNSKWKKSHYDPNSQIGHYLVKTEAMSIYWNTGQTPKTWDLPSQYYQWRNSMVSSLQNYSFEGESFKFVLNPMMSKIKMTIEKSNTGHVAKVNTEIIVQDCNIQVSKTQYDSIMAVKDNFERMLISWQYLSERPQERVLDNQKVWWKYAYWATLEQRVRPLTWSRIKSIRSQYKKYMQTYKQIIANPNDTELKLDLQKHEDNLSIINVVIARQHTRLIVQSKSQSERSFWSMLPSPEKIVLCEKIGYYDGDENKIRKIDHTYNFKLGNFNLTLTNEAKEVLVATLTQTILSIKPNFLDSTYKTSLKIEGIIVEGNSPNSTLTSILASEHLKDSPAFFFTMNFEKNKNNGSFTHRLQVTLSSVECIYNKKCFEEIEAFLQAAKSVQRTNLLQYFKKVPNLLCDIIRRKVAGKWDLNLDIKFPHLVIPESSSCIVSEENLLVLDLGKYLIRTEICQNTQISENATKMEMEEQLYSKLIIDCNDLQILFCDKNDDWKEARKERDTDMHVVPKTSCNAVYALSALDLSSIPTSKFNIFLNYLKFNVSERKIGLLLKFFNVDQIRINVITEAMQPDIYIKDRIRQRILSKQLKKIQEKMCLGDTYKYRKHKILNGKESFHKNKSIEINELKSNMNEAWASTVDLPGLDDNISPTNNIQLLYGFIINEFLIVFSKSSDRTDRQYLMLRLGHFTMDMAFMTYGPAYQMSIHSILLTDKLHTSSSGQYLDLIFTPLPNNVDVVTILYRKVSAKCPDFWSHFHGVETSLVANFGTIHLLLHQEAVHTIIKYSKYLSNKIRKQTSQYLENLIKHCVTKLNNAIHKSSNVPVPPGSVKFSQSARMSDLNVIVCDSDFDIVNIQLSGLEVDFLFRANERFVFRSFLSSINVEHMSQVTLYSKVLYTDEDKVFEVKYVRNASHIQGNEVVGKNYNESFDGSFKFQLGRIHCIFLYKLMVQLQRFVMNLDALEYFEKYAKVVRKAVKSATDTLKNKTKISLSINVCGPVLLIPQKSSSPNAIVIDTGNLRIENFFKESDNEVVENILVKLKEVTVTRGVMTLASTLEMQETLMEPICLNMDIKKNTNVKSLQKNWEIDSVLEKIEITLGQKDLSMIMAIYTDNIGEAKIVDLLPQQIRSPIAEIFDQDDNVRELEAFFCEPKQKFLTGKCKIDEIKVVLFFDAGELLSSPIRDLNHGLCKLEINDIDTSLIIYTDKGSDGKLSVDRILIEEIGPDANIHSKIVLSSPAEDVRNNNMCNITVNKPPIIDVNFHQNKNGDRSADVIVGRMSLSLSIPFCEKVALYVLECIPKDIQELGIVNPGYEAETKTADQRKRFSNSLTISVRVHKPELMFLVETTSNKKRYFITKSEIMIDFSRHCNRLNLVTSFSGLHSLFYDLNEYSDQPYVVLKQCDIELSKSVEENNEKITLEVSGIYVKLCSEVIHSVNDILNDIVEHFKIPEMESDRKGQRRLSKKVNETEDLWEPKKMEPYITKPEPLCQHLPNHLTHQSLTIPKFEIVLIFELQQIQVLLLKSSVDMQVQDWNYLLNCTGDISVQVNYFNENIQNWEPVIDPVVVDEHNYKPWEFQIRMFQDKAMTLSDPQVKKSNMKKSCSSSSKAQKAQRSYTTTESEDSGEDMMFLEPVNTLNFNINRRVKTSLSTFLDDSDSENEEGAMEKLAAAISDLFTGDWNEHEDSDCGHSSEEENDVSESTKPKDVTQENQSFEKCLYLLVNAKDHLDITITPSFLKIFNELVAQYSSKIISVKQDRKAINVYNDIGPETRVELFEKGIKNIKKDILISMKKFENEDSAPNSPTRTLIYQESVAFEEEQLELELKHDYEQGYDFATIRSLYFPQETTAELYDKINRHYVKIFVPNFFPVQTNCSKRKWEKLVKLQSNGSGPMMNYYLAARHTIGRSGREIIISSPLQICNETCFALNILYQPSVLQQLNVEPVGEVTNPFETTMRIAILEAHEKYNVPLYIAYHCKLFIQPAYADGQYASESGIWWKDMATEMDLAYNLICKPKNSSNLEIFALRVTLRRNLEVKNSHPHSIPNYVIRLLPPLTVQNFLPYSLEVENLTLKQSVKAEPGEKCSVYSLDLSKDQRLAVKITYNSLAWTGHVTVTGHLDEKIILMTSDQKDETKDVTINVKCEREGSCNLIFYAPYWIVNKTGLPLKVKASSSHNIYDCPNDDILLFTYKRHCKQSLSIKAYESNWSNEFGVECSGTTGLVICKDIERKKKYMFFLNTSLSNFCPRLTKLVTVLPSFLVQNNTEKALRFMEYNEKTDLWIDLEPNRTLIFWPETSSMQIYVKYRESKLITQVFFIACPHRTVLRMDKGTAITADVTGGTSGPFHIQFNNYTPGDCPVLIQNYCADLFLKIQQQDQSPVSLMSPNNSLLYTWDDPTRPRVLVWNVYNNKGPGFVLDISKDGYGEEKIKFQSVTPNTSQQESSSSEDSDSSNNTPNTLNKKIRKDKIIIYWACFIEGPQRILLFTQEQRIFENILVTHFHEQCNFETVMSLAGIGLSLFTSEYDKKEHMYACLSDSPAIWEVNVGQKWKTLTLELASWIEDKYKRSTVHKKCHIKDYVHIDFEKMFMLKPFFAEMRRTYSPAICCHFRKSSKFQYLDFRLNYLQIDNKQSNCIIFQPICAANDIEKHLNKPFLELVLSKQVEQDFESYRFVKMHMGDVCLNIENDLWTKVSALLKENKKFGKDYSCTSAYIVDITAIRKSITAKTNSENVLDFHTKQCHIEHLSLSSFGIQLNISNRIQMGVLSDTMALNKVLDHLFPYNMAPYMPMEGVHHKITSTEWVNIHQRLFNSLENLADHVACQFLQQYYSHVLGLQVLVNTFAIQSGIESSYPDASITASAILYESQCLLGHVMMSPAALETSIMDVFPNLNLDLAQNKTIRKRGSDIRSEREEMLPKIVANSGKSFGVGVPIALAQLFVKNHSVGIQCDGEMFFKTTGKALFSLITRHPDDKSDCVELAKEALRRATLLGEPIKTHQRLIRYRNILGLPPFSSYESMGQYLLETVGNSRFSNDTYWTHVAIDRAGKSIIIVSLEHVIRITKCTLWGSWEVEWMVELDDIISLPKINCVELILNLRQDENSPGEQQIKIVGPKELLMWLHQKIEQAIIISMEDKSWTLHDPQ